MVKITKPFRFVHPMDKKGQSWECHAIAIAGIAVFTSYGPHPIMAACYRMQMSAGKLLIDIQPTSITDMTSDTELLPLMQQEEYHDLYSALVEMARAHVLKSIFSRIKTNIV